MAAISLFDDFYRTVLGTGSEFETVALQQDGATAVASAYGEPTAYRPEDRADQAVDGDVDDFAGSSLVVVGVVLSFDGEVPVLGSAGFEP